MMIKYSLLRLVCEYYQDLWTKQSIILHLYDFKFRCACNSVILVCCPVAKLCRHFRVSGTIVMVALCNRADHYIFAL